VVRKTTERVKTNALPQSNAFNIPADGFWVMQTGFRSRKSRRIF
jgi:hypothetical protein